eukprot:COSAG01_NODE_52745_length_344_cov_1.244898_1_plen_56_part_10
MLAVPGRELWGAGNRGVAGQAKAPMQPHVVLSGPVLSHLSPAHDVLQLGPDGGMVQ